MELLEIVDRRASGAFLWPFLVELDHSRATVKSLVHRPIVPLVRDDGMFGDVMVGRCPSAHVCVRSASVSLDHARFRPFPDGTWQVIDQHSTNGTFVNGVRLEPGVPHRLVEGNIVRFGAKKFAFGATRFQALMRRLLSKKTA